MSSTSLLNAAIGEYRILDRLGEGGMGEVYRAVHAKIGRTAAIKLMNRALANAEFVERFLNEARIQADLNHPNIVTLYDFCEFDGRPCIIMEYIEGQTLTELMHRRGSLNRQETIGIFRAIVDAIAYVHGRGIIHRDIKSNNVKITPAGEVKVLDFGIAKSGNSPALTMTGGFVGTLQYISPELFTGGFADARSDIWALGVLLYEMTTGRLPFQADSIGGLYERINAAAYAPPSAFNLPAARELEPMIARCLRRNPNERYQTARELLADLERLSMSPSGGLQPAVPSPQPVPSHPLPPQPSTLPTPSASTAPQPYGSTAPEALMPAPSGSSKKLVLGALGGVALFALLIGGGVYMMTAEPDPNAATQPAQQTARQSTPQGRSTPAPLNKMFTIEVMEGQAEVFKDGARVGTTPYQFEGKPGDQVDLVLKREGYRDKPIQVSLNDQKRVYTFTMARQ
jgi:serine/threonine-protein kinase